MTNQQIKDYIKGRGKGKFFGNITNQVEGEDGCYPTPAQDKNGIFLDDLHAEPLKENLKTKMLEDPGVKKILGVLFRQARLNAKKSTNRSSHPYTKYKFQGKRLYSLYKELFDKDESEGSASSALYGKVFLKYAGFDSENDLERALQEQIQRPYETAEINPDDDDLVRYMGFYYSFRDHDISSFEVEIDYSSPPVFRVSQVGFHDGISQRPYEGEGEFDDNGKIIISLEQKTSGRKFEMIIDCGGNPLQEKAMLCSILTVSTYGRVINVEGLIVQFDILQSKEALNIILNIKRYLFLHRYCFRLKEPPLNLNRLNARGVDVQVIKQMVGTFRVWRYDQKFNIIQSRMEINEYYKTMCYTNQYGEEQRRYNTQYCVLSVTNHLQGNRSLCITTHPEGSTEIISHIVLKVLNPTENITGGVLTLTNQIEGYASSRAIALLREEDADFELRTIEKEEVKKMAGENGKLAALYELLEEIQRSMSSIRL